MGLIDVLNGMQNGPHGQRGPSGSSGGMSPITMAILGVLAFKAMTPSHCDVRSCPAADID